MDTLLIKFNIGENQYLKKYKAKNTVHNFE